MFFLQYETGTDDADRRIDRVLRRFLPDMGLSELYRAIRKGFIRINNRKTTQNYRIQEHDVIGIADFLVENQDNPAAERTTQQKSSVSLEILFRNEQLLIINKPYDIPVQKAAASDIALDDIVKTQYPGDGTSLSFTPGPLHRLDKKTTGVLCFSQNLQGARTFTTLLQNHEISKTYTALLTGSLKEKQTWTDYITRDSANGTAFHTVSVSSEKNSTSKESVTTVSPIAWGTYHETPVTLARIEILTGRTHQIRSQCGGHGFPLLGDTAYGGPSVHHSQNLFLHALSLSFPQSSPLNTPEVITAPLPAPFVHMIQQIFSKDSWEKIDFLTVQTYNNRTKLI